MASSSRSAIESLPPEILQEILLYLDPKSLISFMDSSETIRTSMEKESASAFWGRFAKINKVRPYSSIMERNDNSTRETPADRIVALDERIRSGKDVRTWRWDMGGGDRRPYLVEEEKYCHIRRGRPGIIELKWSGKYACVAVDSFPHFLAWNTRSDPPTLVDTPRSELLSSVDSMAVWRHYVMFTLDEEKRSLKKGDELNLLTIFDLEKKEWEGGRSILVKGEEDFELASTDNRDQFMAVLETPGGEAAKAAVRHLLMPEAVFIVRVPEAVVERKILLQPSVANGYLTLHYDFGLLPPEYYRQGNKTPRTFLTLAFPDVTTTTARLLQLDGNSKAMDITPDGDIFVVRAELLNGNDGTPQKQVFKLVLYGPTKQQTIVQDGESYSPDVESESDWKEKSVVELHDYLGTSNWKIRVNHDMKIVGVTFSAVVLAGGESWIQLVDYGGQQQQLRPMYRIQLPLLSLKLREWSVVGNRYLSVLEAARRGHCWDEFVLTRYDARSGEKVGEKSLRVPCFKAQSYLMGMKDIMMKDDGTAVLMRLVDKDAKSSFFLMKFL